MRRQIVFGDSWIEADLPDESHEVSPGVSTTLDPLTDPQAAIRAALDRPLDLPPLHEFARGRRKVTIAFDDPTVPCYAPVWNWGLNEILADLDRAGIDEEHIHLLCANALHRKFTNDELATILGRELVERFSGRLRCHDAEDPDAMIDHGVTPNGYQVDLNRAVSDSDLVIYLNCSTTRGFSGGWKSICVGLSSYQSISHHHDPETMSMSMDRNRMHAILDEMGELTENALGRDRFFKIETVLANPLQPAAFFCGTVGATRKAALDLNRSGMSNRRDLLEEKVDIVLYGVPDWSPYAAFSFTNPVLTLISTGLGYLGGVIEALGKPGCTVILATPCEDRWDDLHHPSYREVWDSVVPVTKDPFEAKQMFEAEFAGRDRYVEAYRNRYGFHGSHGIMALYPLKRLRHASRVIVAGARDPSLARHAGLDSAKSVEAALAEAAGSHGPEATVAFVPYPQAANR